MRLPDPVRILVRDDCRCSEGTWTGYRDANIPTGEVRPMPKVHHCGYVHLRERLIPQAEREANLRVGALSPTWPAIFFETMDRLVNAHIAAGALDDA